VLKIAFVTCADLGRFYVSEKDPKFTRDDQPACDFLTTHGHEVHALLWGTSISTVKEQAFDCIVIRSPWDYTDSEANMKGFVLWLSLLEEAELPLLNPYKIARWNLDKHYLLELAAEGIAIPHTEILRHDEEPALKIKEAIRRWQRVVLKPCIGAAARDCFVVTPDNYWQILQAFPLIKHQRSFLLQPFLPSIMEEGEWSCIFLHHAFSHAVWKLPKSGDWRVQDELGGQTQSLDAPSDIRALAEQTFSSLLRLLHKKFDEEPYLLYARIDIMPGPVVGEIELVEPELFFLKRPSLEPNIDALNKFYEGIIQTTKRLF